MSTEANTIADAARVSEASVCYRWLARQAELAGNPAVAAVLRSIAETKIGHAFALIAEFRDPAELALSLRLAFVAELADAERLERHAVTASAEGLGGTADLYGRLAEANRATAVRLAAFA